MVQFAGKYKQTKAEDYEKFLSKLGVGMMMRKAATASTPEMEISETSPGKWKLQTKTKMKTVELNFEPGKPFEEKTGDGRDCTTTVTVEGNKWTTVQKNKKAGGPDVKVIREFSDKGIDVQMCCGDVVSKQFFERL